MPLLVGNFKNLAELKIQEIPPSSLKRTFRCEIQKFIEWHALPAFSLFWGLLTLRLTLPQLKDEMMSFRLGKLTALVALGVLAATIAVAEIPSPPGAMVYFINLKDGDAVTSPFKIQFGLSGMGVAPVGVQTPNTGHHHLLIDTQLSPERMKEPIPVDAQHRHFGGGQTEVMLTLPAGQHTLQLAIGDFVHIPHNPPVVSSAITITVK